MRLLSILCLVLMILGGCSGSQKDDRPAIAVSFEPQAWMLRQIVGDDFDIVTLLPAGSDPETYQPSISTMKSLGKADIYFTLGTDGFEKSNLAGIVSNFPDLKVVDCTEGVQKITGTHGHHDHDGHNHDGEEFDPHILASIKNSIIIADNLSRYLAKNYPDKADAYLRAGNSLKARFKWKDDSISKMNLDGTAFAIRHPSLSYFARDYNLKQISMQDNGKETTPLRLAMQMKEIKDSGAKVFVNEIEHDSHSYKETASEVGLNVVDVKLNGPAWEEFIMKLAQRMKMANEINRN
ncbi:MAG: zinc ABC transporter substrate-binding protein [Muribaculaceae bacterium]|nr:zinc ABC transporter substrate-binding protein [Muribaculaceae bacterium]